LTLGVGGVGAAAVAARSMTGAAIDAEPAVTATDGKGYAVTEHVRRYYRTMKV
jgi:outer membrane usher protein FimD/PapC